MPPSMCQSALRLVATHRIAVCCRSASPWADEAHSEKMKRFRIEETQLMVGWGQKKGKLETEVEDIRAFNQSIINQ